MIAAFSAVAIAAVSVADVAVVDADFPASDTISTVAILL
jgi:hypothetical protein